MRFAYLGSGSQGNGLVVESGSTRVLLDCGFTLRDTVFRLGRLGLSPEDLSAIVVTHEHDDHVSGVGRLARQYRHGVWVTHGTVRGTPRQVFRDVDVHLVEGYRSFTVGDLHIRPFPVPHDAGEPAQYVFSDGAARLGVLTDAGEATRHIEAMLSGCQAIAIECNHDRSMLADGPYPPSLKSRVSGRLGHLDNASAAGLVGAIDTSRLSHVVAVHLSQSNNTPELARSALADALGCSTDWIAVADQTEGLGWREVR
ncbi:MAG: MBL fold metallo-hydrolase [Betaproteobacteria bacterium]|nr:MBL fold metallo-hydrolase [Betaproteobacteria bacterium]